MSMVFLKNQAEKIYGGEIEKIPLYKGKNGKNKNQ